MPPEGTGHGELVGEWEVGGCSFLTLKEQLISQGKFRGSPAEVNGDQAWSFT